MTIHRTLMLAWGNEGRGDDGLGPALAERMAERGLSGLTVSSDYQLQVEDAFEAAQFARVIFVDADRSGPEPFSFRRLAPAASSLSFSSHSVTPGGLLALTAELWGREPEAWLLGIRGYDFDRFDDSLSPAARDNLAAAADFVALACGPGASGRRRRRRCPTSHRGRASCPGPRADSDRHGRCDMSTERPLILCVDDDPDILEYLEIVLEAEGFAFAGAASAEEGLDAYRRQPPDALVVDLMMEEVDAGTGMVKELRLLGNEAPIFMLSSVGDNLSMTTDTTSLGLAGVFQKPVDRVQLLNVLRMSLPEPAAVS